LIPNIEMNRLMTVRAKRLLALAVLLPQLPGDKPDDLAWSVMKIPGS
jgi:hypothetical protein